jgi:hypothetical protein
MYGLNSFDGYYSHYSHIAIIYYIIATSVRILKELIRYEYEYN